MDLLLEATRKSPYGAYALDLPCPLRDATVSARAEHRRRTVACGMLPGQDDPRRLLAAWHAVLHWLRYDDEPVVTCLRGHSADRVWPIVTEASADTTLQALFEAVQTQWVDEKYWIDAHDSDYPGLQEQLRCHSVHLHGAITKDAEHADFALIRDGEQWRIECATERFGEDYQRLLATVWHRLAEALLAAPQTALCELAATAGGSPMQACSVEGAAVAIEGDLNSRFSAWVAVQPQRVAVIDKERSMSFAELDRLSTHWASALLAAGACAGDCVGVSFDRSHRMVAAQIAVLKIGAAFVPMDAAQPAIRLQTMVDDTRLRLVLTEQANVSMLREALPKVGVLDIGKIGDARNGGGSSMLPAVESDIDALAYVIFTSGSTGRPKGVKVSHGNLLNFVLQIGEWFGPDDVASQFAPLTFDASVAEIHSSLLNGGSTVILPAELIDDPESLQAYMTAHGVSFSAFPPQYAKHLSPENLPRQKTLMTAGSAPDHDLIRRWHPHVQYVNAYGPTETTILSTAWRADRVPEAHEPIAIGSPIFNTTVRVINRFGQALPRHCIGELLIGGAGVTLGYLDRDELNLDRYREQGRKRWYRSGDLCCFNGDSALIFAGRIDSQIKLRGHRLEPGEVEAALKAVEGVDQAATLVAEVQSSKQLIAFCAGTARSEDEVRERLAGLLPAWAIPNRIVWLPALPLTTNGKTDYRALQVMLAERTAQDDATATVEYEDALEADVAAIWSSVLQQPKIARDDNFIHLGGDSLTALVVMSSLKRLGYPASSSQLLARPRLSDFVAILRGLDRQINRDYRTCSGEAPLSPIQGWFFKLGLENPGSFCQTLVFDADERLDAERLQRALVALVDHHDQLRAGFARTHHAGDQWVQTVAGPGLPLPAILVRELQESQWSEQAEDLRLALAAELDLSQAPLYRIALLRSPTRSRVVWAIHHLIVDTISHGILLEDLQALYRRPDDAVESVLPGKSISHMDWSRMLRDAVMADVDTRLQRWQPALQALAAMPGLPLQSSAAARMAIAESRLTAQDTSALLETATACYRQSVEELVLAASCLAIGRTLGISGLAIDIEWHGREEDFAGRLGIDRTVGWFTSVHPHAVDLPDDGGLGPWLMTLKESRVAVPQRGRDFYALRYLVDTPEARAAFAGYRQPEVLFNFSGVVQRGQTGWRTVPAVAIELGEGNANPYALSVESEIRDGELIVSLYHDPEAWGDAAERLPQAMSDALREVIAHCSASVNRRWTPSDFPLAGLSQSQVDTLPTTLRAAYPLTDMQQTMIRHKDTYQVFMAYRMPTVYDDAAWRRAVSEWIDRHDCLRTHIREWPDGSASQLVEDALPAPLGVHRVVSGETQAQARAHIDRVRGGEARIGRAPLFDLQVFDAGEDDFVLVLAIHHLIHDGWSIDLLINDLLVGYRHACGDAASKPQAPLAGMDAVVTAQLRLRDDVQWQTYWSTLPWQAAACRLPEPRLHRTDDTTSRQDTRLFVGALDPALAASVREASRNLGVTVNSLWLAGYACLLRYLGGQTQVRCGVIQNGRMEEIAGVETITGCCVNTLPLVMDIAGTTTGESIVVEVNRQLERMRASAAYPLSAIHAMVRSQIEGELFDTLFNIESHRYAVHDAQARAELVGGYESTNYGFIFSLIERSAAVVDAGSATPPDYEVRIGYDAARYDLEAVQDWLRIYARCMQVLAEKTASRWNEMRLLPDAMLDNATNAWNDTRRDYPHQRCVEDIFREQAQRQPQRPALLYHDQSVTYAALDAQTDRIARVLQDRGIAPETVVGLVADRSPEMVVAMLAIYKAGAAFVPIDPRYPADRVRHMVADSGARLALVQKRDLSAVIPDDLALERLFLDDLIEAAQQDGAGGDDAARKPLPVARNSRQLAYVMYTSGSTGQPKGVMIEQRSIVRLIANSADFSFDPEDRILVTSAPGFDVTTFEVWSALLNGLTLGVIDEETLLDPQQLAAELREKRISLLWLIAPLFNQLIQEAPEMFAGVKQLMIGGDALSAPHVLLARQANPQLQIINGYGPTENTSFSTYHFVGDEDREVIPIGRPITNSTAYVFSADGQLLPPGVNGELYVGGPGVARGYLNQPELTASKFVADPFSNDPDDRLYRTGDLVRWRRDGLIDFLGRIDHQVKIRGFRVELGEIENAISAHEEIKQTLVLVKQEQGQKQLVAYCVPKQGDIADADFRAGLIGSVSALLRETLPEYMVPAAFVMLEAMPRNANGKIDRARLPEPDAAAYVHSAQVMPQGEMEEALWAVWKDVLGNEAFGVTDSFFSIGGDSILAIQVVSGAAKRGLSLTPRLVIEGRTIRQIVAKAGATEAATTTAAGTEQTTVGGAQRLLPIQLQYLQQGKPDIDRYAQYGRIALPADTTREMLDIALRAIVARHDVLRLKFRETSSGWIAQYRPEALQTDDAVQADVLIAVDGDASGDIRAEAAEALAGLDIKQGRLQRWIWRRGAQGQSLLWVIHHLVVDGVSWRILQDDLHSALDAARHGEAPRFGAKTDSYQDWATRVHDFAFGAIVERERDYWLQQLAQPVARLDFDVDGSDDNAPQPEATTQAVEIALDADETQRLLQRARTGLQPQVLLIAALTRSLGERLDADAVRIDLEGHGRDLYDDGATELDPSRTIGWFTSLYPLRFDHVRQPPSRHLSRTRRILATVPNGGIGFGALQQIAHDEALETASDDPNGSGAQVLFNYLGHFADDSEGGSVIGPRRVRGHALRIDGAVRAGALQLRFDYSDRQLSREAATAIAEGFLASLRELLPVDPDDSDATEDRRGVGLGVDAQSTEPGTSLQSLPTDVLGALRGRYPALRDAYPCTPMQQGLLMFSDGGAQKDLYLSQMQIALARVDADRLRRAWQTLVDRHDILRTAFVDLGQARLMQVVIDGAEVPWREIDARTVGGDAQAALTRLMHEEMAQGFDLGHAPLMRLLLVRMDDDNDCLVWTHHHALIDGWSAALLIRQLFEAYARTGAQAGLQAAPHAEPAYRQYIDWLSARDAGAAEAYWRDWFLGLDLSVSAQLPLERVAAGQGHTPIRYEQASHSIELSAEVTSRLHRLVKAEGVSLSTLMLAAWGLLLGKYIAEDEVLFGYTTSGRAAAVEGIESMVGLFINSLPVRVRADGAQTVSSLLRQIQSQQLDNEDHGFLSLPEIQRVSGAKPGQALFDTLVVVENYPRDWSLLASAGADGLKVRSIEGASRTSFGMNLIAYPGDRLMLELAYQRLQFDDDGTAALLRRLSNLLSSIAAGATRTVAQLSLLDADESACAIHGWNATALDYQRDRTLPQVFDTVAHNYALADALVFGDERCSYGELARRSRKIARWLRAHGVRSGDKVALSMGKGPDLIAAMIGIMRAGAAYVPIAVDCPADRRRFITTDAGIVWTLTDRVHRDQVVLDIAACLEIENCLDEADGSSDDGEDGIADGPGDAQHTAYVIYTSGTTGTPKGVAISHRSLINFCAWCVHARLFGAGSRMIQFAPYTFDASAGEIFGGLLAGAELHLLADALIMDPQALATYLNTRAIVFCAFPPPYLQQLDPARIPEDMTLLTAGSAPSAELVAQWGARCRYINGYGPTETTILSTAWICERGQADVESLSIGGPISNTAVYVVDRLGQLCAPGLLGEIWIGGDGVANEYLNRPELNREQFLADPWKPGSRVYRTGDMGRWREDGQIVFVGRRDRQVKLRGFRIELDEIENRLRAHPDVQDASVSVRGTDADKRLLAWVVHREGLLPGDAATEAFLDDLRDFLRMSLLNYMLPQAIGVVDRMPLTGNGKIDEKALPEPEATAPVDTVHVAPRTQSERALAEVWATVLKLAPEQIGANANFFELGGHSLLAMRAIAQLRERLGVEIGVADLLAQPVLADLALVVEHAAQHALPPIVAVPRTEAMPLSFAQQRLWFLAQMQDVSRTYHIPGALRLRGELDVAALGRALDRIVARHEVLRARFVMHGETPMQHFSPADTGFTLRERDLSAANDAEDAFQAAMHQEFDASFQLETGPLLRGQLIRMAADEHVLLIVIHHIVMDGWSLGLLVREIGQLYRSECEGAPDPLPPLTVQYADYAAWQRGLPEAEVWQAQSAYWRDNLRDAPALLELPTDRPRPPQQSFDGDSLPIMLDPALSAGLRALSQRHGVTLFTTLFAAWTIVLHRLSNQSQVVIGIPAANRLQAELEPLVGFFVNTLAVRVDVDGGTSTAALLQQARLALLGAQAHQQLPFEQVVEVVKPPRSIAHSPIFQVMFSWQDEEWRRIDMPGLQVESVEIAQDSAKFDLTLSLSEDGERIVGGIEYATALFDHATLTRHVGYLQRVLQVMVDDASLPIARIPLLADIERAQVLERFNNDAVGRDDIGPALPLPYRAFEAQVARTPQANALVHANERLDYATLNARANRIAHWLIALGAHRDDRVAVCLERGPDLVAAMIGVGKAGLAYVPMDPAAPAERLCYQLDDSAPVALLSQSSLRDALGDDARPALWLDLDDAVLAQHAVENPAYDLVVVSPNDLAYVIYTSGSTGRPKGVMVEHAQLGAYLRWALHAYTGGEPIDAVVSSPIVFDATITSLYLPLLSGGSAVLLREGDELAGLEAEMMDAQSDHALRSTLIKITPAHLRALGQRLETAAVRPAPKLFVVGGEALPSATVALWQRLSPASRIVNEYGPTETTVGCVVHEASADSLQGPDVPIGRPIAGMYMRVLDAEGQPVPIGVAGELCIGGAQVARGYLNRDELTIERFIVDPFDASGDARLYRSGDLCRWRADGVLDYLGRNDFQVKIRGFRIELGEVEAQLAACAGVVECAVIAREDRPGDKRLVAYVVGPDAVALSAQTLRNQLAQHLPEYMVPSAFVVLPALPLTGNGKLDRAALPAPDLGAVVSSVYEAPVGPAETVLAEVWQSLLNLDRVGRHDQFFELGGHSLMVIAMLVNLRERGYVTDIRTVLTQPSLSALATVLTPLAPGEAEQKQEVPENLIATDCADISPELLPLADLSQADIDRIVANVPGGVANIQDIYRLGPLQEGILYHYLLGGEGDNYLLRSMLAFESRELLDAFLAAMQAVIDRHDILRTCAQWEALSHPVQVVCRHVPLPIEEIALEPGEVLPQLVAKSDPRRLRLDLSRAPMLKTFVAHDAENGEWLLALLSHHIVCDQTTVELMIGEIQMLLAGQADRLPVSVPYRNFIAQLRQLSAQDHDAYFRRQLGDVEEPTLPFGFSNTQGASDKESREDVVDAVASIDSEASQRIRDAARRYGTTPAVLFHAAWGLVVGRCSGRQDVVFGAVLSGRQQSIDGLDRAFGMFINTLPLRVPFSTASVRETIADTRARLAELLMHEQASLSQAQRCSGVSSALPLFSAMINFRHSLNTDAVASGAMLPGVRVVSGDWDGERTNYPLTLDIDDTGKTFTINIQCMRIADPKLVADYVCTAAINIAEALHNDPDRPMRGIEILPDAERRRLVTGFNDTFRPDLIEVTWPELFAAQVSSTPDRIAVECSIRQLSYRELDSRSTRLALALREKGAGAGTVIALLNRRSSDLLVMIIAVLKVGAAYLPLDPTHPPQRWLEILDDAKPQHVLIGEEYATEQRWLKRKWKSGEVNVAADLMASATDSTAAVVATLPYPKLDDLSYVLFTSGSTGKPKGVMIEHRGMINNMRSKFEPLALSGDDVIAQTASQCFDISVWQFLTALLLGGKVVIVSDETTRDPDALLDRLRATGVTIWEPVPSVMQVILQSRKPLPDLRWVLPTGEALPRELVVRWFEQYPQIPLMNAYGPAECSDDVSFQPIHGPVDRVLIGKPVANAHLHLLDDELMLAPIGVVGEIAVSGPVVGRGYHNKPEETRAVFKENPYERHPADRRLYLTGDLGRRYPDGSIEFIGRKDFQVKIRGFRIELGEIENCLERHPAVREAVVLARSFGSHGDKKLVAYVTTCTAATIEILRAHIRASLPEYMTPSAIVMMDALPLTGNGKIDRKALPEPTGTALMQAQYAQPQPGAESLVADVWRDLLGLDQVGREDAFFDLGGDSILLIRMLSRIREHGIVLSVADIYRLRTVQAIAEAGAIQPSLPDRLVSEGWEHAWAVVDAAPAAVKALLVRCREGDRRMLLQKLLASCDGVDAQFVRLCDDPAAEAQRLQSVGLSALDDDTSITVSGLPGALSGQLRQVHAQLIAAPVVETYGFGLMQRNLQDWTARYGNECIPVQGWYTSAQLQAAFARLASEQDLLRSIPDLQTSTWRLLDQEAIGRMAIPALRLAVDVGLAPDDAIAHATQALERARAETPLAYSAAWISATDTQHYLLLSIDHLAWDGVSAGAVQRRLGEILRGDATPFAGTYRAFVSAVEPQGDRAIDAVLDESFDRAGVASAIAATRSLLAQRADGPLQVVRFATPIAAGMSAAEQAFEVFKRWMLQSTGLERFGLVLNHHGRQRGEHAYFDHVGLFLDKVPISVGRDTTLRNLSDKVAELQRRGLGYLAMEARARSEGLPPTLPALSEEVLFNFQMEAQSADHRPTPLETGQFREKLRDYRGILFESHEQDNQIVVTCAFRGSDGDLRGLMSTIPDSVLIESSMTVDAADAAAGTGMTATPNASTTEDDVLIVEGVHKRYGDFEAVKGVSFRVPRGKCFGILGPNGAGKTSLLAMIEGLTDITSGSIRIFGMDVATQMRSIQPHLGVQLQQNNYFQFLTVAQLLKFYQELRSAVGGKREGPSAEWLLERLELKDKLSFKVDELSGGQKQRLSIAIALLEDPDIIFLDEPTSALDPQSRIYTWEFIEQLKNDGRKTIILTTHYMEEAERLCDDIMIMNGGKIIAHGPPAELVKSLSATQSLNLQFGNTRLEAAHAQSIGALDGVISHGWDERSDTLSIQTTDVAKTLEAVLATCRDRGIPITNIDIVRPSLEDVFLSHTGKDLRE
ncbi:MAG: amino acid adenylation domain-containing protein [Lysobacteraceae bacterium]